MGREKFQGEPTYIVTEEWRRALKEWFEGDGRESVRKVAERLGVAHTSITGLMDGTTRKSTLVGPLSRITGLPLPVEYDEEVAAALSSLRDSNPEQYRVIKALILQSASQLKPRQ